MENRGSPDECQEVGLLDDLDEVITAQLKPSAHIMDGFKLTQQTQAQPQPYVTILVQPQSRALRFRYKCEGRYPGALTGLGSTAENKTYPTIRVENYVGKFVVAVSCVTKDHPYHPHPHNIVSKEDCRKGVYRNKYERSNMTAQFSTLGIQCVKKTEVKESLEQRKSLKIDPFNTRYDHMGKLTDIDLNAVRLCFQVFIESIPGSDKFDRPLDPVVSDVIYDRKAMSDLHITKLSHPVAPMAGGLEMIVLCDKVSKDDIEVFFYEKDEAGRLIWEEKADNLTVHKQVAVCFRSPDCRKHFTAGNNLQTCIKIEVHLRRSRVNEHGDGRDLFLMSVSESGTEGAKRKRFPPPNLQMQIELMQSQDHVPMIIPVPRYEQHEIRHGNRSPRSDGSPARSPQWMNSPQPIMNAYGNGNEISHILPDAGPGPANPQELAAVNETAERLDSILDLGLPSNFNNNDINLNNLNMNEVQMTGPSATPVANGNIDESNYSVPNLSASMFESETSVGQLELLDSDQLQFKQEEK
ncbi:proto-oncogene c-Rel [Galendromus occidentalis]|uniref:Proto-oncogene c-Rel n=1 Tax=Galendromus occidentalis TaxID=34638 RepID=A0AAJ6QRY1_9ACAR|nr:proto-oncogene c-Rel [Galendromus occidentalis]